MYGSHAIHRHRSYRDFARQAKVGAGPGFLAGVIFVIMLAALAAMNGETPFRPLYMFGSLVLGSSALHTQSLFALVLGTVVTVMLSTLYGMIYALLNKPLMADDGTNWPLQALLGGLFGAALWLVNFQFFSRLLFPWLVPMPQLVLLVAHALFFGVPLGFFCAQVHSEDTEEAAPR